MPRVVELNVGTVVGVAGPELEMVGVVVRSDRRSSRFTEEEPDPAVAPLAGVGAPATVTPAVALTPVPGTPPVAGREAGEPCVPLELCR